jgi:hypothetical protein
MMEERNVTLKATGDRKQKREKEEKLQITNLKSRDVQNCRRYEWLCC